MKPRVLIRWTSRDERSWRTDVGECRYESVLVN